MYMFINMNKSKHLEGIACCFPPHADSIIL